MDWFLYIRDLRHERNISNMSSSSVTGVIVCNFPLREDIFRFLNNDVYKRSLQHIKKMFNKLEAE